MSISVGEISDPLGKVLAGFPARSPVNGYGPIEGSVAFVVVLSEYVPIPLRVFSANQSRSALKRSFVERIMMAFSFYLSGPVSKSIKQAMLIKQQSAVHRTLLK